jgi:hypothetical protein
MIMLIAFAVIVIIGLIGWLIGRNSGSDGTNQPGETSQSLPPPPPAPDQPTYSDDNTPDSDNDTDTHGGSSSPNA